MLNILQYIWGGVDKLVDLTNAFGAQSERLSSTLKLMTLKFHEDSIPIFLSYLSSPPALGHSAFPKSQQVAWYSLGANLYRLNELTVSLAFWIAKQNDDLP